MCQKEERIKVNENEENDLIFSLEDIPPWYLSLLFGLQHYLTMFSGAIAAPLMMTSYLCISDDSPYRGEIISTTLFASGLATFLQVTFGCRLPIIQGPSLAFLVPIFSILSLPQWKCPSMETISNLTHEEAGELWMSRMREVQGAVIVGAVVEVFVGLTGLIGFLMKFITPLSIAPTVTLIGLALFKAAAREASGNWWVAALTIVLLVLFSQYLAEVQVPVLSYSKNKKWHVKKFPVFKLLPVILTITTVWGLCGILTASNVFSETNTARTDLRISTLAKSSWIRIPYPGQWGMPTFNIGPALGVIAGVISSSIESVGDYYACAKLSGGPSPPTHAVNRGIMVEGLGCVIAGCCGTGCGLTSFSQNIGAIAITKVGSRRVIQFASVIITLFAMVGKLGTLFISIPSPIMGGIFCVMFAIITGVGLSSLQYVNLNSSRNIFILGFSIFMGLFIPNSLENNPDLINTGSHLANQILEIFLKTSMFIGGVVGCFLDNTIPASKEERGILKWEAATMTGHGSNQKDLHSYDLPFGMTFINKFDFMKYFPICPIFKNENLNVDFCRKIINRNGKELTEMSQLPKDTP